MWEGISLLTRRVGGRWVKTAMGQGIADALGLKEGGPTLTPEDSAKGLLEQVSCAPASVPYPSYRLRDPVDW
jgi:hypothetical protein